MSTGLLREKSAKEKFFVNTKTTSHCLSQFFKLCGIFFSVQECDSTWEVFEKVAVTCKDLPEFTWHEWSPEFSY